MSPGPAPRPGDAARLALRTAAAAKVAKGAVETEGTEGEATASGGAGGSGRSGRSGSGFGGPGAGFGPHGTDAEETAPHGARDAATDAIRDAVSDAARDAASDAIRDAVSDAARDAASDAIRDAASDAARDAARPEPGAGGARPGDIAREALRAAREERRRAAEAAAEASSAAPARVVRPLPSPHAPAAPRHSTARDLKQFLATAFRMPPADDEPEATAEADLPPTTGTLTGDPAATSASASPPPTGDPAATSTSVSPPPTGDPAATSASASPPPTGDPAATTTPASPPPATSRPPETGTPNTSAPYATPASPPLTATRPPETDTPNAPAAYATPATPAAPHLPRTMATPHRDTELRRTFPSLPSRAEAAASGADFADTWWGNAWVRALEEGALDVKRLARGRSYAEQGHVDAITVTPGLVLAYVQGSRPRPYRVQLRLRTFGEDEWERFLEAAADRPGDIAALLDKELPQALADSGIPLLPGPGELEPRCSCPDFGHPCKHAAALCYQTARLLDADPFVLLLLRGRGEREVLDALSRRNAARAARERQPAPLPGVRATEALLPRRLPPLPPPLPVPPHPEQPPVYPGVPGGPDPFALDQLATDAAARAHALLATGRDPVGELTLWQDAVRLAAARPGSGLTASTRALYASLADAVGRTPGNLARAVAAWRQGGLEGLAVLEEPWDPPAGRFDRARPLLLAADLPVFRPWHNHLTHPAGHLQLRLGRDGLWYAYESEPGHDDWWPRGTPDLDPVGALTGLGASDDL
ncbi:SWIM zinc finger family protein [Streptomyces sp. NPDC051985]|uniref:SWIM zinc finger family protein n=1 Tax=Streptomyces sp. NPDC051985 TaxID=3155807 RepID=UPI0034324481